MDLAVLGSWPVSLSTISSSLYPAHIAPQHGEVSAEEFKYEILWQTVSRHEKRG